MNVILYYIEIKIKLDSIAYEIKSKNKIKVKKLSLKI